MKTVRRQPNRSPRNRSMSVQPDRLNGSFFLAIIGIALATIAEHIVATGSFTLIPSIVVLLILVCTLVYGGYTLFRQIIVIWKVRADTSDLAINVFLGSMIWGLASFASSLFPSDHASFFSNVGIIVLGLSAIGLLCCIAQNTRAETDEEAPASEQLPSFMLPAPQPKKPQIMEIAGQKLAPPPFRRIDPSATRVHPDALPPLFTQDRLHQLPQTHRSRFFNVTKLNEAQIYGDDACAISDDETSFALCDGASGSSIPRPWAALLALEWLAHPLYPKNINSEALEKWLEQPRSHWEAWIQNVWRPSVNDRNRLTGDHQVSQKDVEQLLYRGADATFLGVYLDRSQKRWHATAVGDTCLFHIKPGQKTSWRISMAMPVETSSGFTQTPPLLTTRLESSLAQIVPYVQYRTASYQQGDVLLMATDALAQWLIMQSEKSISEWQKLLFMQNQADFEQFVLQEWEQNLLEEDDTTLVIIPL